MKTGKSLVELAQELESIKKDQRDFVVPTEKLVALAANPTPEASGDVLLNFDGRVLAPSNWAHAQLAGYTDVPKAYYDRLRGENPKLLASNINHGLSRNTGEARMIRTVGSKVRAVLSSRYRRLDSYDLLETTLPILQSKGFEVMSSEITEKRLYVKAVTPRIQGEVKKGDAVQYGLVISSSDVGAGSVRIEPLTFRLICSNGMISESAIRKTHLGRNEAGDDIQELLTDKTRELSDAAFWAQVRDVVVASMDPARFEREVAKLRDAAEQKITRYDIPEVVELSTKRLGMPLSDTLKQSMVAYLANGADGAGLTAWGLANAYTFAAQSDEVSYDDSIELERAGARIIELPRKDWKAIAEAA